MTSLRRAVFLDRDGVLNYLIFRDGGWYSPRQISDFHPVKGLKSAISALVEMGFLCVVVTNQPDIARGFIAWEDVSAMNARLHEFGIDHFYVCPHDDSDECKCRKPHPGLLLRAADELSIDLKSSWLIGDRDIDVQAANAAGALGLLIDGARYNSEQGRDDLALPSDLDMAVSFIQDVLRSPRLS